MNASTRALKGRGLDANAPEKGIGADCYAVAVTATMLGRRDLTPAPSTALVYSPEMAARHAVTLHRISGQLHRISERQCNENLACRECGGTGEEIPYADRPDNRITCRKCAGRGNRLGRRDAALEAQAREIAEHYGLRCYFQGDPRGCALYLIPPEIVPKDFAELGQYRYKSDPERGPLLETLRSRWIESNYNRGHAIVRLGR